MRVACSYSGSSGWVRAEPNTVTFGTSRYGANTANASRISVIAAAAIFRSSGSGWSVEQAEGGARAARRRRAGRPAGRARSTSRRARACDVLRDAGGRRVGGVSRRASSAAFAVERGEQLVEALLEAGHALALELVGDVVHVDADLGQPLPHRLGLVDVGVDAAGRACRGRRTPRSSRRAAC